MRQEVALFPEQNCFSAGWYCHLETCKNHILNHILFLFQSLQFLQRLTEFSSKCMTNAENLTNKVLNPFLKQCGNELKMWWPGGE